MSGCAKGFDNDKACFDCVTIYAAMAIFIWGVYGDLLEGAPLFIKGLFIPIALVAIFSFVPIIGVLSASFRAFRSATVKTSWIAVSALAIWMSTLVFLGGYLYYIARPVFAVIGVLLLFLLGSVLH